MTVDRRRTDDCGRAFAGSQLQIQIYVNRRASDLDRAILATVPDLRDRQARIRWVSPIEPDRFAEYHDEDVLRLLGLQELAPRWKEFWPRGGPHWDALGIVELAGGRGGPLLLEAKSHVPEVYGGGCQASPASRAKIDGAFRATKKWLGVPESADWTGPLYQSANRLASLYFFREVAGIPAWLVNVYFLDDPHSPTDLPAWKEALGQVKLELCLDDKRIPYAGEVLLPARQRSEILASG